jgi:hypothetical protein
VEVDEVELLAGGLHAVLGDHAEDEVLDLVGAGGRPGVDVLEAVALRADRLVGLGGDGGVEGRELERAGATPGAAAGFWAATALASWRTSAMAVTLAWSCWRFSLADFWRSPLMAMR